MKNQIKENGMWINSADGNSLVLAVKFYDGSIGLVRNKKNEDIKINFDDTSFKIPGTKLEKLSKKYKVVYEKYINQK